MSVRLATTWQQFAIITQLECADADERERGNKADQTAMNSLTGRVERRNQVLPPPTPTLVAEIRCPGGNASGDLIPNPTFDPAYDQMGFTVGRPLLTVFLPVVRSGMRQNWPRDHLPVLNAVGHGR
jgi:hypothetical protein